MICIKFLKVISINAIIAAIIRDATNTTMALFCNSFQVGHDTLYTNSLYDSLI